MDCVSADETDRDAHSMKVGFSCYDMETLAVVPKNRTLRASFVDFEKE
jgi:hypothetical protein